MTGGYQCQHGPWKSILSSIFIIYIFSFEKKKRKEGEDVSWNVSPPTTRSITSLLTHSISISVKLNPRIFFFFFFFLGFFFIWWEENDELIIHQWPPTEEKEKKFRWTCRHNFFLDGGISFDSVSKDGRPTDTHWQLTASFFFLVEKFSLFFSFLVVVRVVHQEFGFAL